MNQKYRIVAIPGEGIGSEVVESALTVLKATAQKHNFKVRVDYGVIGQAALEKYGSYFPEETAQLCMGANGIVFGAVTQGGLLELRQRFDLFANFRPVKTHSSLLDKSSLKRDRLKNVDILFVRELVGGIYFGKSARRESCGYHTMYYEDWQIKRIAEVALEKARQRRKLLTVAHKENALPHLPWTKLVEEVAKQYPDVSVEPMLVDNLAMQLVVNPQRFDVIVAGNLFGDILSDLGGALVGSIGLLGSASLNSAGFGLYEPVHGTALDIAGKNMANPFGAISSVMMMLAQWRETAAVNFIQQAWDSILARGYRTADLNPQGEEILVSTDELVELFLKLLN
jgi:3-isopropylmalate dehydrogenase